MTTGWKIAIWSFVILGIALLIWHVAKKSIKAWENISFGNYKWKVDLQGLQLKDIADILLRGEEKNIIVDFGMDIYNKNSFSIPFCYFEATFYYQGIELVKTSDELAKKCHRVPSQKEGGVLPITDHITLKLSKAMGALLINKFINGQKPKIDYTLDLTLFGISLGWICKLKKTWCLTGSFPWE